MGSPLVRPSGTDDVEQCVAIVAGLPDFFTPDVPVKVRRDLTAHRGWVVDDGGAVVGFAVVRRDGPAAELLWAAVAADRRGTGIGTGLVERVLDELGRDGVRLVEVKTLDAAAGYAPYEATRAFWSARGFVQIDRIVVPEWGAESPAAVMVCALVATRSYTDST